jgi:serine/threonine protein kinase
MMEPSTGAQREDGAGEVTARYRVLFKLSEGGTANVFLGVAQGRGGFNKLVVLKAPKEYILQEAEARRMFMNEARLAARLNHANIVQTNEVAEQAGRLVIVMEYLEGQPLSSILARGRAKIPLAMHLAILSEALSALHYAHEYADFDGTRLNIVHRDMTPHNLFVTFDGHVKLLDFGIAKLDGADSGTQPGVVKGKIRYMSAQQVMGEKLDRRADVFAVGVMLWEAATRDRMWRDASELTLMHHIVNDEIPLPSSVKPDVSPELQRICMKALAHEPHHRYATAAELQTDIDALRATLGQNTTSREIGSFVSDLFEDVRASTRRSIEAQLSRGASLSWDEYLQTENEIGTVAMLQPGETGTSKPVESSPAPNQRGRLGLLAVALAALAALIFAPRGALRDARPEATALSAATAPPPTVASAATPAMVTVTVSLSASPIEAKLYLDETALETNPFSAKMPRDGVTHHVRAEAPGYVTTTTGIVLDKDAAVVLSLEKAQPKAAGGGARKALRPSSSAVAAPKADCNPPFFIDERGIKKFKPECL